MQERTESVATPRRTLLRPESMSARQRRRAIADLIAAGIERAIAAHSGPTVGEIPKSEESAANGLALSPESRLSVPKGHKPDRNEIKAGDDG